MVLVVMMMIPDHARVADLQLTDVTCAGGASFTHGTDLRGK